MLLNINIPQAPVPVKPWTTTYNATYEKHICFQVIVDRENENEDCLFVNIFSPIVSLYVLFYLQKKNRF